MAQLVAIPFLCFHILRYSVSSYLQLVEAERNAEAIEILEKAAAIEPNNAKWVNRCVIIFD